MSSKKDNDNKVDPLTWLLLVPNQKKFYPPNSHAPLEKKQNDKDACGLEYSKTIVSGEKLSHTLVHFIACCIYSSWHGIPFSKIATQKKKSLMAFTTFINHILKVTTLQLSVVLLSLKLVLHLKSLKPNINGAEGSEYRLLVCTLMLSMKLLIDNTYTNFTWQKVSCIPLDQINTVEVCFFLHFALLFF